MKYKNDDIDKLLESLKIEEVVGEVVDLKKSGANYKGLCPFHSDNSPSFIVSPQKNISKCFVCGSGGNPISFYMKYHSLDFGEAVRQLAQKYNIDIKVQNTYDKERTNKNEKLYHLMEDANTYFSNKIFENEGKEAFEYLSKRGFKADFIKNNNIGYGGKSWDELISYLISKNHSMEDILLLGLAKEGEKGTYSVFRNRVMFPIRDWQGRLVAFGGRSLEGDKNIAKYLNSPETPIFYKRENLYGIKEKGNLIRKKSYAILMEGYLDVLKAQSYGFDVALASLGTAFTPEQAQLLKRYTSNVIIAYDMDKAGRSAVISSSLILKEHGFNIRVLEYQDAKDPDEFLDKFGKQRFLEEVKESKEIFDFLYEYYAQSYDLQDLMSKQNFINSFKEFFSSVENELEKNLYLEKISNNLNLDKSILYEELIKNNNKKEKKSAIKEYNNKEDFIYEKTNKKLSRLEEESLKLILVDFTFAEFLNEKEIESELLGKIIDILLDKEKEIDSPKKLMNLDIITEEESKLLFEYMATNLTLNANEINSLKLELILSWFRLELNKKIKEAKNDKQIIKMLNFKKIEDTLNNEIEINESLVKNLYIEFKNLF